MRDDWSTVKALRSQNATLKKGRGKHRKYLPYVFTEHDSIMAAIVGILQRIMALIDPPQQPVPKKRRIGFGAKED
jgi:hypothetical protein